MDAGNYRGWHRIFDDQDIFLIFSAIRISQMSIDLRRVLKDSVRMYFAPLTGAFNGVRTEVRRTDREIAKRTSEDRNLKTTTHG